MGELIELAAVVPRATNLTADFDAFMLTEGLELLASFRSIDDGEVRRTVLTMVSRLAGVSTSGKRPSFRP